MLTDILDRHRGPYRLCVTRPNPKTPNVFKSEWLKGEIEKDEVIETCQALLTDLRDTIVDIAVYSEHEQSACMVIRPKDLL